MPTNVINVAPGRTYGNNWLLAGQGIQEGLSGVLDIYNNYNKQKQFEENARAEREYRKMALNESMDRTQAMREDRQSLRDQRAAAADEANALAVDPAAIPDEFMETKTPSMPLADFSSLNIPSMGVKTKTPMRTRQHGSATAILDYGGQRAKRSKQEQDVMEGKLFPNTPALQKKLDEAGLGDLYRGQSYVPGSIATPLVSAQKTAQGPPKTENIGGRLKGWNEKTNDFDIDYGHAGDPEKAPTVSAADRKAAKDDAINAMIDSIQEGIPESIPAQYRGSVIAMAEGRNVMPRAGTNFNLVTQMAFKYNPQLDMQKLGAQKQMRLDMAKGSTTSRGGQITSLNTLADHFDKLQKSSDELSEQVYGATPFNALNSGLQSIIPGGYQTPAASYRDRGVSVRTEYVRALSGAAPTDAENREFDALKDSTLSPAERQVHIETLREMAAGRANAQEAAFQQAFGKHSWEAGTPLFVGGWVHDDTGWRLLRKGERAPASPRVINYDSNGNLVQ